MVSTKQFAALLFPALFFLSTSYAQQAMKLAGTSWTGTHSPLKKGTEIYFQGDTLVLVDMEGIKPADQYLFVQQNDTLLLHLIDELSIACREEKPGRYKIFRANNGEKMLLKPIEDPCIERFTILVSESPWYRKPDGEGLPADWLFLDPSKTTMPAISLYDAYKLVRFRTSAPVVVALADQAFDATHEDLTHAAWQPAANREPLPPATEKGTAMAGIIAAKRNNGKGIEGLADQVKIMALGAPADTLLPANRPAEMARRIRYAADNGARIVVADLLPLLAMNDKALAAACWYAQTKNVLLVCGLPAGSQGMGGYAAPAKGVKPRNCLVAGSFSAGAGGSAQGALPGYQTMVDLAAPGTPLFSTLAGSQYGFLPATLMPEAVVAGVAALVWSYFPSLTVAQLKQALLAPAASAVAGQPAPGAQAATYPAAPALLNAKAACLAAQKMVVRKKKP